jgi:hypothetical protein
MWWSLVVAMLIFLGVLVDVGKGTGGVVSINDEVGCCNWVVWCRGEDDGDGARMV